MTLALLKNVIGRLLIVINKYHLSCKQYVYFELRWKSRTIHRFFLQSSAHLTLIVVYYHRLKFDIHSVR